VYSSPTPLVLAHGLVLLLPLWRPFTFCVWLANQVRANVGLVPAGMLVVMAAIFTGARRPSIHAAAMPATTSTTAATNINAGQRRNSAESVHHAVGVLVGHHERPLSEDRARR